MLGFNLISLRLAKVSVVPSTDYYTSIDAFYFVLALVPLSRFFSLSPSSSSLSLSPLQFSSYSLVPLIHSRELALPFALSLSFLTFSVGDDQITHTRARNKIILLNC